MGVASLVLGIIALVTGWIPFICFIAFFVAVTGLILGIVEAVKKGKTNEKKGLGIAGLILSAVSIPIIAIMSFTTVGIVTSTVLEDYEYRYDYNKTYDNWYDDYEYNYEHKYDFYNTLNKNRNFTDYNEL